MPFRFQRSIAHKVACTSLYRALLKQCNKFQQPTISKTLTKLIKHRFERDRRLQSPSQVQNGLKAGKEALLLLHNASIGSPEALKQLTQTISTAAQRFQSISELQRHRASLKSPTRPSKLKKIAHLKELADKRYDARRPETVPVLQRPVPFDQLPGKIRVIPRLVITDRVPILVYSRRPPRTLRRAVRYQKRKMAKRWRYRAELAKYITLGGWEDNWDQIVQEVEKVEKPEDEYNAGIDGRSDEQYKEDGEGDRSWCEEAIEMDRNIARLIREEDIRLAELAQKMWDVSVAEREMARNEKEARKQERRALRRTTQWAQ